MAPFAHIICYHKEHSRNNGHGYPSRIRHKQHEHKEKHQGVNYSGPYSFSEQYEYEYSPDGLLLWRSRSDSNGGSGSYKASYDALGRNTFTEISIDGTITSTLLTQYELGPWPVYQASIATGSGSTVIEAEYKTFASDKYQELVELVNSLLSGE